MDLEVMVPGPGPEVAYLEETLVPIRIRNASSTDVVPSRMEGHLCFAAGETQCRVPFDVRWPAVQLKPGDGVDARAAIRPGLRVPRYTVTFDLRVSYRRLHQGAWQAGRLEFPDVGYVIVRDRPPSGDQIFISHKDPEDRDIAGVLKDKLVRVGLGGYMAEDDPRYGTPIWAQKLPDAIRASRLLAVLWTQRVIVSPTGVQREIGMAREFRVPVAGAQDRAVPAPPATNPDEERAQLDPASLDESLGRFAEGLFAAVERVRRRD